MRSKLSWKKSLENKTLLDYQAEIEGYELFDISTDGFVQSRVITFTEENFHDLTGFVHAWTRTSCD